MLYVSMSDIVINVFKWKCFNFLVDEPLEQAYTWIHDRAIPKLCWGDAKSLVYAPTVQVPCS